MYVGAVVLLVVRVHVGAVILLVVRVHVDVVHARPRVLLVVRVHLDVVPASSPRPNPRVRLRPLRLAHLAFVGGAQPKRVDGGEQRADERLERGGDARARIPTAPPDPSRVPREFRGGGGGDHHLLRSSRLGERRRRRLAGLPSRDAQRVQNRRRIGNGIRGRRRRARLQRARHRRKTIPVR